MAVNNPKVKAVFFDFMGTCLDWHASVLQSAPSVIGPSKMSELALEWRRQYFVEISERFRQNLEPEDIDITLARAFEAVLSRFPDQLPAFDSQSKKQMIEAWHSQRPWPEVQEAIQTIRDRIGLEVFVHANGTTRLQLDLTRSSGLDFNMLFSSQLLGLYKPNPDSYKKALELVQLKPEEVVMVAAHAYDLRGAKECGMKTIYIHRWTDDVDENMENVRTEVDVFLDDMTELPAAIMKL